jgi:hypothetical protein
LAQSASSLSCLAFVFSSISALAWSTVVTPLRSGLEPPLRSLFSLFVASFVLFLWYDYPIE